VTLLRRIAGRPAEERALTLDPVREAMLRMSNARLSGAWAGVPVTPETVLSVPAVWACTQLTAGVISQLPFDEYRKVDGGRLEVAPSQLLVNPSADVPFEDWVFQAIESAQLHGSAYGAIVSRDRSMWPTQVELIHPDRIQTRINPETRVIEWKVDNQPFPAEDLWRMTGRPALGTPLGLPLLHYMGQVAGVGIAARKYGSDWFAEGGAPSAVISPARDPGEAGAAELKQKVINMLRSRQPVVMPQDVEVKPWGGSTPKDAQLVDLLRNNATDIAMFYLVPPELVGGATGDSMTYSNVDARVLNLLVFGVSYWLTKLEKAFTRSIPRDRYVKANESAIIRTDVSTRTKVLATEIQNGIRTINEARQLLDLEPLPGGDSLLAPNRTSPVGDMTAGED
jgi:HK97 family phage portal protein